MSLDSHACLWNDWASGLGVSGAQACKCLIYLLLWQLRHQGLPSNSLLPSSCSQQKGHLHWTSPSAREGETPEPPTSRTQSPVLGPAFISGFPKEKFDQALEEMQVLDSPWQEGI